jgi:hypothetical protein
MGRQKWHAPLAQLLACFMGHASAGAKDGKWSCKICHLKSHHTRMQVCGTLLRLVVWYSPSVMVVLSSQFCVLYKIIYYAVSSTAAQALCYYFSQW